MMKLIVNEGNTVYLPSGQFGPGKTIEVSDADGKAMVARGVATETAAPQKTNAELEAEPAAENSDPGKGKGAKK